MTEYFTLALYIIGGNAVLLAAVIWLLKKIISNSLSKEIKKYEIELKHLIKKNEIEFKTQHDVTTNQKYFYFLPFKYSADEYRRRLIHIINRFSEKGPKYQDMVNRFKQNFDTKTLEWYVNDQVGAEGGYFITSTIYTTCSLFFWMKRIQQEHPFIPLVLDDELKEIKDDYKKQCLNKNYYLSSISKECDIYDFIRNIKNAIAGKNGIPHGLHDSIGDLLFNYSENRIMNFFEFCEMLNDKNEWIKFSPVFKFWQGIVAKDGTIVAERLERICILKDILEHLKFANIRE